MWMQDERSGEATEEQPSISHTFRHVYRFILQAMQGDTVAASALFQEYLAGELPEELLALSRRCVQEDQKGRPVREINGAPPATQSYASGVKKNGHLPESMINADKSAPLWMSCREIAAFETPTFSKKVGELIARQQSTSQKRATYQR
jgi:hypothetical protein